MWESSCPRKIGFRSFLTKYSKLFPERVERYAKDHWMLTQDLVEHGRRIANRTYTHPSMFMLFLIKVGIWKNPHGEELRTTITNIASNSVESIKNIFEDGLSFYWNNIKDKEEPSEYDDGRFIDIFGRLQGFGKETGSRKMVSAILRFLDPIKYGTVDYRNWAILSNTEFRFLDEPLLEPLATTLEESKHINIDTRKYLHYLKAIRKLAREYGVTTAEVDMALFAYSDEVIPSSKEVTLPTPKSEEKATRMMEVIQQVADSVKSLGLHRHARILLTRVEPLARKGDYEGIYQYCKRAVSSKSNVDEMIEKRGGKSLRNQFLKIKEIYESN